MDKERLEAIMAERNLAKGIGTQVFALAHLMRLAKEGRCVIVRRWGLKPRPVAFVQNMSGRVLYGLMQYGIYEYIKQEDWE